MRQTIFSTLALLVLVALSTPAEAASTILIDGVLTATGGGAAADGAYDMRFSLYTGQADPLAAWSEGPVKVVVSGGRFHYAVGATKPLDEATVAKVSTGWFGMQVGSEPEFPRTQLHAVLHSLRADTAAGLDCSGCVASGALASGAVGTAHVAFPYAGSKTKGGPANSALDLACTGCVSVSEMAFDADVDLGGNGLKAKKLSATDVVAGTVAATKFEGDGSALTGIKIPSGTCKTAGEVVKGIKPDGTLECVAAMDTAGLPKDGLDEISNDLLANQFLDDIVSQSTPKPIPDNNPVGIDDALDFPDIGIAQKLTVHLHLTNSDISAIEVFLFDPDNNKHVLYSKSGKGTVLKTAWPDPTKQVSGDLTAWVGKNPKGKWRLVVSDTAFLNNKDDGKIEAWGVSITTLSSKKVQVKGNLVLATQTAPCDAFAKGAIRYNDALAGLQVCDGVAWFPRLVGLSKDDPGLTCKAIKDNAPRAQSGVYWIDPDGVGKGNAAFEVYCDQETGGGGWALVAKVKGNDKTMNRINTAQWRNKQKIGGCADLKDENALCDGYDKVPFSDVMIRSLAKPMRNLAWGHRDVYPSVWNIVNAGTRVYTRNRLFGAVHNLDYNGDPVYHRDCAALSYGFLTADWGYNNTPGIAGHAGLAHGHSGGVVGASLNDWNQWANGKTYGVSSLSTLHCLSDFALGSGYYDAKVNNNDSYAINAHWWGAGNDYTGDWNSHGLFVR